MSKIVAYASSTRPNHLWSAAQYESALPKNRTECDIPLVAKSDCRFSDAIQAFEGAYPELYWHIAKGKICAGEPLYGAIITTQGTTELGHGESDVSAEDAFMIAISDAGLTLRPSNNG